MVRYLEDKFQAQIPAESSIRSFVSTIFEQVGTMESFDDWLEVQLDEMSLSRARPAAAQAQAPGGPPWRQPQPMPGPPKSKQPTPKVPPPRPDQLQQLGSIFL